MGITTNTTEQFEGFSILENKKCSSLVISFYKYFCYISLTLGRTHTFRHFHEILEILEVLVPKKLIYFIFVKQNKSEHRKKQIN